MCILILFFLIILTSPLYAMDIQELEEANILLQQIEMLSNAQKLIILLQKDNVSDNALFKQLTKLELEQITALNVRRSTIRESTNKQLHISFKKFLAAKKNHLQQLKQGTDIPLPNEPESLNDPKLPQKIEAIEVIFFSDNNSNKS